MSCHIRPAAASDLDAILDLERAAAEAPHWPPSTYAEILTRDQTGQTGFLRRRLFAAFANESLAGFAAVSLAGQQAELESIAVAQSCRRQGIGRDLCRAAIGWCREQGATSVELEVRAGSHGARRLYEELCFRIVGTRPAYYRDPGEDAILMHLSLG